jgi:hypothetical protein
MVPNFIFVARAECRHLHEADARAAGQPDAPEIPRPGRTGIPRQGGTPPAAMAAPSCRVNVLPGAEARPGLDG